MPRIVPSIAADQVLDLRSSQLELRLPMKRQVRLHGPVQKQKFQIAARQAQGKQQANNTEAIDWICFWVFVSGLAWLPIWYGGNDFIAWGANAVVFPGIALVYEA